MLGVAQTANTWPDTFDLVVLIGYLFLIVGVPVVGYVLLAVDIRAHYRRLRQALVAVTQYTSKLPSWVASEARARRRTPRCVAALGLAIPFTEEELLEAYRQQVKTRHPDCGGDRDDFLKLQRDFEEARSLLSASD